MNSALPSRLRSLNVSSSPVKVRIQKAEPYFQSGITSRLFEISNRHALILHVLGKRFPPLFKPHPKVNPSTGRVLSKPSGGDNGLIDWYEGGEDRGWRNEAGMANVVRVVVEALEVHRLSSQGRDSAR